MPSVVEQQIQAPEPMTAATETIASQQPKPAPAMTTGDEVGLRGVLLSSTSHTTQYLSTLSLSLNFQSLNMDPDFEFERELGL
ncbi:hypothetical protein NA56DRAFT_696360 [Hyaloscypha hepaticicola]|uniref:Uncharacterized protein n=1 Tax=Hyaloscypha hepaticicola TaxID=2082293 RepID=A0A2J6QQP8_9HELO|nr:hypothetical protein NA56DRAFT_696360 [Hyaloscypha hepaticicola]